MVERLSSVPVEMVTCTEGQVSEARALPVGTQTSGVADLLLSSTRMSPRDLALIFLH